MNPLKNDDFDFTKLEGDNDYMGSQMTRQVPVKDKIPYTQVHLKSTFQLYQKDGVYHG